MASSDVAFLGDVIKPLVQILLSRCSDSNRRTARLSIETLVELGKGANGELAVGKHTRDHLVNYTSVGGVEYVLQIIFSDKINTQSWQVLLGKLLTLDRYLEEFSEEFYLQCVALPFLDSGYQLKNYDRLMTVVEFAFELMNNSHANVSTIARRVFVLASRLSTSEPGVYNQILDMVATLDSSLQTRLKRRMRAAVENWRREDSVGAHSQQPTTSICKASKELERPKIYRTLSREEYALSRASRNKNIKATRSASRSPGSRIHLRSTSQSPKRFDISTKFTTDEIKNNIQKNHPQVSVNKKCTIQRPTNLPLDCSVLSKQNFFQDPAHIELTSQVNYQFPWWDSQKSQPYKTDGNISPEKSGRSVGMWVHSDSGVSSFKSEVTTPSTPVPPRCTPSIELEAELEKKLFGCGDEDVLYYETLAVSSSLHHHDNIDEVELPHIPGLSPSNTMDDDVSPHKDVRSKYTLPWGIKGHPPPFL